MTITSVSLLVSITALIFTFGHYFIKRPASLLLCYIQNFVGVLFLISAFVKAVDPLGFSYKLEEYFEVFADYSKSYPALVTLMNWFKGYALFLSIFMTTLEMAVGWLLIFGIRMKVTSRILLLLILFFTFLTGFSWYTGKITDCGCFGDAVKFTNAETFYKDVFLTFLILIIYFLRRRITPLFSGRTDALLELSGILIAIIIPIYSYNYLPLIDFRAYKVGNDIREEMKQVGPRDSVLTSMIYKDKKSNEEKSYSMNNLPWKDSVWMATHAFVRQESVVVRKGVPPRITDFKVWSEDSPDITTQVLDTPGYKIWIIAYDINKTEKSAFKDIVALANDCQKHDIKVTGLTSSPYEIIDPFRHDVQADFPFYYSDGTVLKTMIRSNPGIMLLNGSKVLGMWHYHSTPTYDKLNKEFFHQP